MDRAPVDRVAVTAADVLILRKEFLVCERTYGLFDAGAADSGAKASNLAKCQAVPGAPQEERTERRKVSAIWRELVSSDLSTGIIV